jgi:EAL domain-containing protein (putative c-di-GMP-specific phosphodiesterase class I)
VSQLKVWQKAHPRDEPLTVSVNLSVKQFNQSDLIEQIGKAIRATGISPTVCASRSLKHR